MKKLTNKQFKDFCAIVHREAGIHLTTEKRELLNARISKRIRKLDIEPETYLRLIKEDGIEMEQFLNAVSTNHTFFFREAKSFKYLDRRYQDIWCAASSSGEEPYSLATYCLEQGFEPRILATDISTDCIEKGHRAIYSMQKTNGLPQHILKKYFQEGHGQWKGYIRVKANVRRMVNFKRLNLISDHVPSKAFDIIFCRNVMIYFDNPTKELVVNKLCTTLKTGGYFIIGGAESLSGMKHNLTYIEPSVYQN